jgi:diaminopropionate ammonia-lyase
LVELPTLAAELGVARVLVKDESQRLGLPAFKVLGASWAVARVVERRAGGAGRPAGPLTWDSTLEAAGAVAHLRLVTATDGNHGRAVARMARLLGLGAQVFVPDVMTGSAEAAIAGEGATVARVDGSYDDAVAAAAGWAAQRSDAELVQDTAWDGYEDVPEWVVEGYDTLCDEIDEQLHAAGHDGPDLVAVPVGVGSLAQAVVAHYRSGPDGVRPRPSVLSVEPDTAACVLASLRAGALQSVATADTVMAGLNCGTPSSAAWPVLQAGLGAAVAVTDAAATQAVADLAMSGVSSGPSGACTLAGVRAALLGPAADDRRVALGVTPESVVVLISTEGRKDSA